MTVRVWDRSLLKCLKVLRHSDWVWSLVPHDTTVASTSGSDVYVWDSTTGSQIAIVSNAHVGNTYSLARSHTGKLIFTGGEDGAIHMFEISNHCVENNLQQVATWIPHSSPVNSLAFEFPWLVSASSDGKLSLIDVQKLLKPSRRSSKGNLKRVKRADQTNEEPPQRMLHGFGSNLFSVDIAAAPPPPTTRSGRDAEPTLATSSGIAACGSVHSAAETLTPTDLFHTTTSITAETTTSLDLAATARLMIMKQQSLGFLLCSLSLSLSLSFSLSLTLFIYIFDSISLVSTSIRKYRIVMNPSSLLSPRSFSSMAVVKASTLQFISQFFLQSRVFHYVMLWKSKNETVAIQVVTLATLVSA
ncbi:hypothetical protein TEA_022076 [Camellia sinensis var. sinensis]|uniref:Uncharacterized protein n=1 Tax=Camellia sinensis var. sinensis TaxID=542762 RepID=A0A4V3WMY4_CAMSN|nr:hypothetical protein TEA_022076 [Camellia sinensis var. sinensis]